MAVSISRVTFEHHRVAFGIGETQPRISWRFGGNTTDWKQSRCNLEIFRRGLTRQYSIESDQSLYNTWPDQPLEVAESAAVRVQCFGLQGQPSTPWSDWVTVETGLLGAHNWAGAIPIAAARTTELNTTKQVIYFRKSFSLPPDIGVDRARLYITAQGIYEAEINGQRVGDEVLAPGWQTYDHRHVYNTFDVTPLLIPGHDNAIGVTVAEGWYSGRLWAHAGNLRNIWGDTVGFQSLLIVTLQNGSQVHLPTDTSWQASKGPVVRSGIYDGEDYDSRLEADLEGWSTAAFGPRAIGWMSVKENDPFLGVLSSPDGPPVRRLEELPATDVFSSPSGKTLVDFGQNLVGWVRLKIQGPAGTKITLRHAEVLENGELATAPLRTAKATDTIILHGKGPQIWEPRFTFHGFRYAEIEGLPEETTLNQDTVSAIVIHSDFEQTGWFDCSHELLNKFHANVRWSMKGNFISIPTDCPQRDERLGWTGDAHVFGPTSYYLYDTAGFWRSWHRDLWSEMSREGKMIVPHYVPAAPPTQEYDPRAVWGDVAVGGPYNLYRAFGDLEMLKEHYRTQSRAWIDTGVEREDTGLWNRTGRQYGDWLDPLSPPDNAGLAQTAKHLVADAYLVHTTGQLAEMAETVGDTCGARWYGKQRLALHDEYNQMWMPDGTPVNKTQTAYALALQFGLFPDNKTHIAGAEALRSIVAQNDYKVGTGFAGTHVLGHAMTTIDATPDFYRMLLQTSLPSWLYQVAHNATTTWERWDSLQPNGSVNSGGMTSFNHYAFGSVADWIHRNIGGIAPTAPGYKQIAISPVPGGGLTHASARFISPYGEISTHWELLGSKFRLKACVPPNTNATVTLPYSRETQHVGSGCYNFEESRS